MSVLGPRPATGRRPSGRPATAAGADYASTTASIRWTRHCSRPEQATSSMWPFFVTALPDHLRHGTIGHDHAGGMRVELTVLRPFTRLVVPWPQRVPLEDLAMAGAETGPPTSSPTCPLGARSVPPVAPSQRGGLAQRPSSSRRCLSLSSSDIAKPRRAARHARWRWRRAPGTWALINGFRVTGDRSPATGHTTRFTRAAHAHARVHAKPTTGKPGSTCHPSPRPLANSRIPR
jgi:hypothetical protein